MTPSCKFPSIRSLARWGGLVLLTGFLVPCDSTEDDPWYHSLAGTYTGELTVSTAELNLSGSMTATVEQSGSQVTLSGSVQLLGQRQTLATITGTVNNTGFFTLSGGEYSGSFDDPECGTLTGFRESINFSQNGRLEFLETYDYELCGRISARAVLQRS